MLLDSTTRKLQLVLTAAKTTNDMPVCVYFVDTNETDLPQAGMSPTNSNGATVVDILSAPEISTQRKVNAITVNNADTAAKTVKVYLDDNGTDYLLCAATLQVGDVLGYTDTEGFYTIDANGARKLANANYALVAGTLAQFASTTSAQLATLLSDETGSGLAVFNTSPTLVTPDLGVATATSINKVAITQPATGATVTVADGKTLTVSNTVTLTATDGATLAIGTGGTMLAADGVGSNLTLARITGSTYSTIQHWRNNLASSGVVGLGGVITDAGGGTINVTTGSCAIRATTSHTSTLYFADYPAALGLVIPSNTVRYVGIEYNAGSPIVTIRANDDFDYMTNIPLGVVTNEGGILHVNNADRHDVTDAASHIAERFEHTAGYSRDETLGGLILGEEGTRNITVSSGALWQKLTKLTINAFNSSTGGVFSIYYRDGVGGFTKLTAQTQWPNTQYDNGTGTLATLASNKYAVCWFYLEADDSDIIMLYGRAEHGSVAAAESEAPPATLPNRVTAGARIIGKLVFQKSAATAASIASVFTTTFSTSGASVHSNLANLDYASAGHTGFQPTITSSADLAATLGDETGTGVVVFNSSPTLVTPSLGTPASGTLDNCTSNTEAANNNSTQLATTAYADRLTAGTLAGAFTTLTATTSGVFGANVKVWNGFGATSTNVGVGDGTLSAATLTGHSDTASGYAALWRNTTGSYNTANGCMALRENTTGSFGNAAGTYTLMYNTTGSYGNASGFQALHFNVSGNYVDASGYQALYNNTTGSYNTGHGALALYDLATTAIAATAMSNGVSYKIVTMGSTSVAQWQAAGAVTGTAGETFTANGAGVGTGTVATTADIATQCLNNTALGYNTGRGIITGSGNTILGANVTGLAAGLTNNIILADGTGAIKGRFDGTNWTFSGAFVTPALGTPASGTLDNCTSNTETAANNSTQLATTAYADRLTAGTLAGAFTTLSASGLLKASDGTNGWIWLANNTSYGTVAAVNQAESAYRDLELKGGGGKAIFITSTGISTSADLAVTGTIKGSTTIGVGNATPAASGAGITFPATQSASSNANTLDDYEEGTWTPVVVGTTAAGAGTYGIQTGTYTKVGNLVYVTLYLAWSAHTGTGDMRIAGLPVTVGGHRAFAGIESYGLTATNPIGRVEVGDTYIALKEAVTATNVAMDTSVAYLFISATYRI